MELNANVISLQERYLQGQIRAVIWDMDGVLVDTMLAHSRAFEVVLNRNGFSLPEDFSTWGSGRRDRDIIKHALELNGAGDDHDLLDQLVAEKVQVFIEMISTELRPIPGVEDWLVYLNEKKVSCAVASSSAMGIIVTILQTLGFSDYFQTLISGARLPESKPDPGIFLAAAAALKTSPSNCLVVEDALAGVEAARRAGMLCLALATTVPAERLVADLVLPDLSALSPEIIFS